MLWPDTMQVLLSPEGVDYRVYHSLERKAKLAGSVIVEPGSAPHPWSAASAALQDLIAGQGLRRLRLEIILSDRFVHYQVLPWQSGIISRKDWRAYATHCFEMVYGESVRHWSVRFDIVPPGRESLACAIQTELLDSLRNIAHEKNSRIVSVRPNFVFNINQRRSGLRKSEYWFAVVEQHQVCLAAYDNGYWVAVRNEVAPDGWRAALPGILRRTQCTLAKPVTGDLYLCGNGVQDAADFNIDATPVHILPIRTSHHRDSEAAGAVAN